MASLPSVSQEVSMELILALAIIGLFALEMSHRQKTKQITKELLGLTGRVNALSAARTEDGDPAAAPRRRARPAARTQRLRAESPVMSRPAPQASAPVRAESAVESGRHGLAEPIQ